MNYYLYTLYYELLTSTLYSLLCYSQALRTLCPGIFTAEACTEVGLEDERARGESGLQ
jgi:hypothetical protein